jgi:predicted Zn-ribbon and HTH transcriptional regulator
MPKKERCLKCTYEWESVVDEPKVCPRCKSYFFREPRKRGGKSKGVK